MKDEPLIHLDLFSGIGGFALATERVWPGIRHTFVEWDPFCQAVLRKHWPTATIHGNIKELRTPPSAHLITGGFPCQPFSSAGKRRGTDDDRHLWPEMLRIIRLSAPEWVIGENVGGLLTWDGGLVLESVLADLEGAGYEAWPIVIPACAIDAPHRRDRVWIVAHARSRDAGREAWADASASASQGIRQRDAVELPSKPDTLRFPPDSSRFGPQAERGERHSLRPKADPATQAARGHEQLSERGRTDRWEEEWPAAVARLCSMDDGLPGGLVRPRGWRNAALKAAGNAIVPQVAEEIMRAISTV